MTRAGSGGIVSWLEKTQQLEKNFFLTTEKFLSILSCVRKIAVH